MDNTTLIIALSIMGLLMMFGLIVPISLCIIDQIFKTSWSCKTYGWHNGGGITKRSFDGCSNHGTCSKCGKEVMQDGQGNWF
jgi:hypothetical protein